MVGGGGGLKAMGACTLSRGSGFATVEARAGHPGHLPPLSDVKIQIKNKMLCSFVNGCHSGLRFTRFQCQLSF